MRQKLASIPALRRVRNLSRALRTELQWRSFSQNEYARYIAIHDDPWAYAETPFTWEKFDAAVELLSSVGGEAHFRRAWEIGCAQGAMTIRVAPICEELLAVDFVPLAVERARVRCRECGNVSFGMWDLKVDSAPSTFDLIMIMDVLSTFGGRRDVRRARDKLADALVLGGYLLYGDYVGEAINRNIQNSWYGRLLLPARAGNIARIIGAHPALVEVRRRETERHLLVLFQKRFDMNSRRRCTQFSRRYVTRQKQKADELHALTGLRFLDGHWDSSLYRENIVAGKILPAHRQFS
jgi:Nodulation protein S (NodS)